MTWSEISDLRRKSVTFCEISELVGNQPRLLLESGRPADRPGDTSSDEYRAPVGLAGRTSVPALGSHWFPTKSLVSHQVTEFPKKSLISH